MFFQRKNQVVLSSIFLIAIVALCIHGCKKETNTGKKAKLYWFIPDGMRADPELFNIYEWAEQGELPNIKKMMDQGTYGYSIPVFPGHTPVNFATLLTGSTPKVHGVADGPMHVEGRPLDTVAIGGFSSSAKKVPPIWVTLEEQGKTVAILSTPGSTPPEIDNGLVIRGRWGGWGADFHAINFESKENNTQRIKQGRSSRLFFFGPELTRYLDPKPASGWQNVPHSFSVPLEAAMESWGATVYAYLYDTIDDKNQNYDSIIFSLDKKTALEALKQGAWSDWYPISLKWQNFDVPSHVRFHVIILDDDGYFRIRLFYNNLNKFIVQPENTAEDFNANVGPMMDFVDNFPPQLIYYPEDKKTFLEEQDMSFEWHTRSIPFIIDAYQPDAVIHDIYNPNQMLTSRWWMGYIDPKSARYDTISQTERDQLWIEVKDMYKDLDRMIGEIMQKADENTIIVLSSDHGIIPWNKEVRLNNLFAQNGLLTFKTDQNTLEPIVDWNASRAIYLQMDNIYINPNGLLGNYSRASGPEYETLRDQIIELLISLEDETGKKPIASITKWEDAEFLDLPEDRVGDLIIANEPGYGWDEEMSSDLVIFSEPLASGYKQAVYADNEKGMWTPFIIMGPGIRKGYSLPRPINHIDQYPTIFHALGLLTPSFVEGTIISEAFVQMK